MIKVSEVKTDLPTTYRTLLQQKVYECFTQLQIPFTRVDNDPAITMEDCIAIDNQLCVKTSKTLFLCNRQQTVFYLFVTRGDKPSFAPESFLAPMLGTEIGATTVFSSLLDSSKDVNIVFDLDVLNEEYYGGTDGTNTGYLRIRTTDLTEKFLPFTGRNYKTISV